MMRKAKVAPFKEEVLPEEDPYYGRSPFNTGFNTVFTRKEPTGTSWHELIDLGSTRVKRDVSDKWKSLVNTVRYVNKIKKRFEEVRENLAKNKTWLGPQASLTSQCLLETGVLSEFTHVQEFLQKRNESKTKNDWIIRLV